MSWLDSLEVGSRVVVEDPLRNTREVMEVEYITPGRQRIAVGINTYSGKTGIETGICGFYPCRLLPLQAIENTAAAAHT